MSFRDALLTSWLGEVLGTTGVELHALAGDASLRRYFRLQVAGVDYVVMDSPPEHANVEEFIDISKRLQAANVIVPEIVAANLRAGFLLLSDLGRVHYLDKLCGENADSLYDAAFETLSCIQNADTEHLPTYDRQRLTDEINLFEPWFIERHLRLRLGSVQKRVLSKVNEILLDYALRQPQCFVHRDYHSRNLMIGAHSRPGVLDYQDAVSGPVTYDLVSLLRDVYIVWPKEKTDTWVRKFFDISVSNRRLSCSLDTFRQWFDLMGVQRHLKIAGIFCRLFYRDSKPGYLKDIPVTLNYLHQVCAEYEDLRELDQLMIDLDLVQRLIDANKRVGIS